MKYETLKEGTGSELKGGQTGQFTYVGKLEDGKVIEDHAKGGRPQDLTFGEKITGWQEALPGMRVGEVRKLVVPPALAYGEKGRPPRSRPTRPSSTRSSCSASSANEPARPGMPPGTDPAASPDRWCPAGRLRESARAGDCPDPSLLR